MKKYYVINRIGSNLFWSDTTQTWTNSVEDATKYDTVARLTFGLPYNGMWMDVEYAEYVRGYSLMKDRL